MTAAVITATHAQIEDVTTTVISGSSARRYKRLYLEGAKAAQNDWFLLSSYISAAEVANVVSWEVVREASGNAFAIDVATLDSDDYKLILTEATAGTAHAIITFYTV